MKKIAIIGGGVNFGINSVTQPFFALYAAQLGASTAAIGVLLTLRAVLPLFIAMPAGQLIDRLGAAYMLRMGNLITAIALAMMAFSTNLTLLTVAQVIIGGGTMIVTSALQVIVSEGGKEERERDITRYSAWSSGGSMIGPLIGGAIVTAVSSTGWLRWNGEAISGYRATFFICFVTAAIFGACFYAVSRKFTIQSQLGAEVKEVLRPREIAGSYLQGIHLLKHPGVQFGLVGTFLIHFIQSIWQGFFPLYLDTLGYSALVISVLVSIRGLAGMTSRLFMAQLTRRWSHQALLIGAGCIAAISLIALPLMNWNIVTIAIVAFVLGSSVGVNMPVSTMIMVDEDSMGERGKIMGLRLLVNRSAQIAAPALFGVFGQMLGLASSFFAGGGLLLASILGFGLYRKTRFRQVTTTMNHVEVEK
ncbi:MFS transporter [Paenibacillus sp. S150]|uniref:MFS transporter n=1 Tax=Paenibacillus sp. S150 TaxID=2749826 RepID=UPI001C570628|nr:MFS transporter [Paenibacillus sp. S150]MBW4084952.1 MFS transporter [Paenibacillus sp. S150]